VTSPLLHRHCGPRSTGAAAGIDDYDITPNLGVAAMHLGDLRAMAAVHERMLSRARQDGVLVVVLYALTRLSFSEIADGAWSTAVARQTEALELGAATGQPILAGMPQAALLLLSALRGEKSYAERLSVLQPVLDGPSTGVLDLLLRDLVRWARAVHAFPRSDTGFHHLAQLNTDVVRRQAGLDRIEAAVHHEQRGPAGLRISDLERFAVATDQTWAAAIAAHGRALLLEDADTDRHFDQALQLHRAGGRPFDHARTEFAYGEHPRRTRRRVAAREHLRAALRVFEDLKAGPWVERAQIELRASGESVRHRDVAAPVSLTPQEFQVALLVQQGLTNRDVAGQLFVSPRTVDFHLRNVFTKTGVSSRTELAQLSLD
jgi:DNA-binding NarL/FixJ family response regulator